MPRGTGQDIVRVRTAEAGALAASPTIRLEYALPALKVVKEPGVADGQSLLVLGNAPVAGDAGKPMLPVVPCYVALPAGSELDSVEVVCGKETKLAGRHVIPHGQKPIPLLKDAKGEPTAPDAAVYGSDEPWPKARHEVVTVQKKRGMSVLVVNLNPVVYRPKSGDVSYYGTMELQVKTRATGSAGSAGSASSPQASSPQAATAGEGITIRVREDAIRPLTEQVDNPATVETYKAAMK
jgi:hypothetical protein